MEDSISIMLPKPGSSDVILSSEDGMNLPRGYPSGNEKRLLESENKLKQVFEEYSSRIESLILLLDKFSEGLIIINSAGEICYSNEAGLSIANEIEQLLPKPGILAYNERTRKQNSTIKLNEVWDVVIEADNFIWSSEACNLFLFTKRLRQISEQTNSDRQTLAISAPFKTLMGYVQQISDYETNGKTAEAAVCAAMADKSIEHSELLLSDLKSYISLNNYQLSFTQLSMQKMVGDVLKGMGPEIEEAEIEVSVTDLPEAMGDKELILKLLRHLIRNAVKFRNKNRKAIIDIGHDISEGQYIFCIRDNGIGISKKYHDQIFELFSTLNEVEEYPGNGLGLAVCKKIVELHDGRIWVESLPGHGSNFYFKLNAKK